MYKGNVCVMCRNVKKWVNIFMRNDLLLQEANCMSVDPYNCNTFNTYSFITQSYFNLQKYFVYKTDG